MTGGDPWRDERPTWWTKPEAMKHLGMTRQTINAYIRTGRVRVTGTKRTPFVHAADLQAEFRRRVKADRATRFRKPDTP